MVNLCIEAGARAILEIVPEAYTDEAEKLARATAIAMVGALDVGELARFHWKPDAFRAELVKRLTE